MNTTLPSPTIHCNPIGFRPDDPLKRAVMPVTADAMGFLGGTQFQVIRVSELVKHALNAPGFREEITWLEAGFEDTPLGRYAVCDLTGLSARGGYQILCGGARSYPFLIYRDAWKRCFRLLLEWYRIAACGVAVPGYHEVCHLDDCRMEDTGEQVDLVGGWHDAGDLRKWTSTMSYVTLALTDFIEEASADLGTLGVDPDLVWGQIRRGAEYLLKMIDPQSGLVWHSIASDTDQPNGSGCWTDNIPNSGDERGARRDCLLGTADLHVQTLAALARCLRGRDDAMTERLRAAALRIWNAWQPLAVEQGGVESLGDASLQLWRTTEDRHYADTLTRGLRVVLDRQVAGPWFGQDRLRGYFLRDGTVEGNDGFRRRGGRNLYQFMRYARRLAQALTLWPHHGDAARWRDGLALLLEGCVEPMMKLSPYRALPACLCADGDGAPGARPLPGQLRFRYFGVEAEGNNCQLAEAGASLALAARALGQPRWAAYGQKQLEWVLGFNPHEQSMMTGLGYSQAAVFSFYVGQIPGAIINGYTGTRDEDTPVLCMNREVNAMNMEYWSVHTAAFLRALAVLENERLS